MTKLSLLLIAIAYLCGSIPVGLIIGRLAKGIDIREYGSGNIGASNVWRILGRKWGALVFAADVCKGFAPVFVVRELLHQPNWMPILIGLGAIVGHNASVFLRFKGGKGVATSLGVAIGMSPAAGLIGLTVWLFLVWATRYISVSSITAVPICCVFIWFFNGSTIPYALFGVVASVFAAYKHKSNVARLKAGTENRVTLPWDRAKSDPGAAA